jgi:Carboxypeptidase regulatory-like domain/TonB dependent receptor
MRKRLIFAALFVILALILSIPSFAQVSTASINGVVTDPSGAAIPDATIVLRNVDTSVENTTVSNKAGVYSIFNITPGQYTVKATASGFSPKEVPVFTLTVGYIATINFSLLVGSQTATVTVQAATPQLEVSSANLGAVISTRQVNDLPLNGRNFTQLLTLTPGVSPISTSQNNGGGFVASVAKGSNVVFPSVNGQGNRSNFFLADGMNDYEVFVSTYAVPPIIDAIQEFKVVSHTDSAEFGGVLGGVINVTTKSGTDILHGSAWEYARNAIFDARTYFLPPSALKASFSQNQFGGAIGGPVWIPKLYHLKDKTFFFGGYQGFRYTRTNNTPLHVPTTAELSGNESDWPTQIYNPFSTRPDPNHPGQYISNPFPGNQIPSNLIQQNLVAYSQFAYPAAGPVIDSSGDNALDTTPVGQVQNEWDIRVDQRIGANDSAFFRYSAINSTVTTSGGIPGLLSDTATPARDWGGSYVHVFSPSLVMQGQFVHVNTVYNSTTFFTKSTASIRSTLAYDPSFSGQFLASPSRSLLPNTSISGYAGGGEFANINHSTDSYVYSGSAEKTLVTHALHFGGDYTTINFANALGSPYLNFRAQNTADPNPLDTVNKGSAFASFLLGVPNSASVNNTEVATRSGGVADGYAQDSWKLTPNLTINYGLRYDVTLIPNLGKDNLTANHGGPYSGDMDFTNGTYVIQKLPPACNVAKAAPCIPGDGTLPAHVVVASDQKIAHNIYTNFGPRIGFAYQVGNNLVIRGAFGIVYDNWAAQIQIANNNVGTWPDIGTSAVSNLNLPSAASAVPTVPYNNPLGAIGTGLLPAATPFNQLTFFYDPHRKNPMSKQWNFGGEQQLNNSTAVTLNYVGMSSTRLDIGGFYNTALTPGPGDPQTRSLYPYIIPTNYDRSAGSANYNALQAALNKRYDDGWSYSIAYTWSKVINVGADGFFGSEGGVPQDPYHPAAYDRSVAGFDLPNILAVDLLYQVPLGRGKRFSTGKSALDYVLGNWQFNSIFTSHSGVPFTPVISSDIANTGNGNTYEHLNLVGNPHLSKGSPTAWFNKAAYAVPAGFTYGTAGRNSLRSARYWDLDSSVFRQFPIGGERQLEFRAEAFNLLNNVVLGQPFRDYNQGSQFGTVNTTANTSREIQLAMKFTF